jgi:hypothetical protein
MRTLIALLLMACPLLAADYLVMDGDTVEVEKVDSTLLWGSYNHKGELFGDSEWGDRYWQLKPKDSCVVGHFFEWPDTVPIYGPCTMRQRSDKAAAKVDSAAISRWVVGGFKAAWNTPLDSFMDNTPDTVWVIAEIRDMIFGPDDMIKCDTLWRREVR